MRAFIILAACCFLSCKIFAQDAASYYQQGLEKAQAGQIEEAIKLFSKSIELRPEDAFAWVNRGVARSIINRCEEALADFERAIQLDPGYKKAHLNKAIMKRRLTDYEGAIADYTFIVSKLDPAYSDAWFNRGLVYEMLGNKDSACHDFNKAVLTGAKNMDNKLNMCKEDGPITSNAILRLSKNAPSDQYGFSEKDPVRVGTGPSGGPANQRAFLELLRDTRGNPVQYKRLGSCCQYESKKAPMGFGMLDRYQINYTGADGNAATAIVFISFYEYEEPMILSGFKTITR
jgi:tetratricopeptide (TPR) repeat protein